MDDDLKSAAKWGLPSIHKVGKVQDRRDDNIRVYKSKRHRDKVNAKVMKDSFMNDPKNKGKSSLFDMKRMA